MAARKFRSAARLLVEAQDLLVHGNVAKEQVEDAHKTMAEAVRCAARGCLHDGEHIVTTTGDHRAAAVVFAEGEQLYRRIGDREGEQMMADRVKHENTMESGVCAIL